MAGPVPAGGHAAVRADAWEGPSQDLESNGAWPAQTDPEVRMALGVFSCGTQKIFPLLFKPVGVNLR